jgi:hypothetical protein
MNQNQLSPQELDQLLLKRQQLAISGPGNICTPGNFPEIIAYDPFVASSYTYQDIVEYLNTPAWRKLRSMSPAQLVALDPFEPSEVRPGGYKVWDGAIAIPKNSLFNPVVQPMSRLKAVRNCNDYWIKDGTLAMCRVGPIGPQGQLVRPRSDWIFDLKELVEGWRLLELAHHLTVLRGYWQLTDKGMRVGKPYIAYRFQSSLAEVLVARAYNLPLDIGERVENRPGRPDLPYYGIEIKSSSRFQSPFMRVPKTGKESLRIDETLAVVCVGVFIEPPPSGYVNKTQAVSDADRWCCMPTMGIIAGWELADVITHQAVMSRTMDDTKADQCYCMAPEDLMPPASFYAYLDKARKHFGTPEEAIERMARRDGNPQLLKDFRYVDEYIKSPEFEARLMRTQPMLTENCMVWNYMSDGSPDQPGIAVGQAGRNGYQRPHPQDIKKGTPWHKYLLEERKALKIINTAIQAYEGRVEGKNAARRKRLERIRAHKLIVNTRKAGMQLKRLERKRKRRALTFKEQNKYIHLKRDTNIQTP